MGTCKKVCKLQKEQCITECRLAYLGYPTPPPSTLSTSNCTYTFQQTSNNVSYDSDAKLLCLYNNFRVSYAQLLCANGDNSPILVADPEVAWQNYLNNATDPTVTVGLGGITYTFEITAWLVRTIGKSIMVVMITMVVVLVAVVVVVVVVVAIYGSRSNCLVASPSEKVGCISVARRCLKRASLQTILLYCGPLLQRESVV